MKKKILIMLIIFVCFFVVGCNKSNDESKKQYANIDNQENVGEEIEKNKTVTVSFDSDGGTPVQLITLNVGDKLSQTQNPTKDGYEFLGWYYEEKLFDFSTSVQESIILKAKWQIVKTFEVTFNSNGGTAIDKQIVKDSEKVVAPSVPVKTGYKFLQWELNNKKYDFNTPVTQNITLIAKWEKNETQEKVTYEKYKDLNAVNMNCYTEESIKANNFQEVKTVKKGDKFVCTVDFETYSTDKVKKIQYTLSYGSGLKLVKSENVSSATKNGNTYTFTLSNPTSLGEAIGEFTFEVVGTSGLTYGIKDVKFTTSNNKNYYTNNQTVTLSQYSKYKDLNAVNMICYTEESVQANNYELATVVKKGDKIVCTVDFETYSTDKVKKLQYTLSYGSGLKLVKSENVSSATKNGNTYTFTLSNPTSLGEAIGEFTFEVVGTSGLTYGIKDIIFETSNNGYYTTNDKTITLSQYSKYKDLNAVNMSCYTETSVQANNYELATNVKIGDKIVCIVHFETNAADKVQKLQYTLSYGSGLKLVKSDKVSSATKNGNTYAFTLSNPTSVGGSIGEFTFEVVGTSGLTYGIKDISFTTSNNGYYTTNEQSKSLSTK